MHVNVWFTYRLNSCPGFSYFWFLAIKNITLTSMFYRKITLKTNNAVSKLVRNTKWNHRLDLLAYFSHGSSMYPQRNFAGWNCARKYRELYSSPGESCQTRFAILALKIMASNICAMILDLYYPPD